MAAHPIRLAVADDDLRRCRLAVFFRVLLFLPHLVWALLWLVAVYVVAIINWFVTLFSGTPADWAHRFLSRYLRYWVHILAFLLVAANPFPGFTGRPGSYPVDLEIDRAARRHEGTAAFRCIPVHPAPALH